jgi:hypothetical protein
MAAGRLSVIGWFFVAILVSGVSMSFAGKALHAPLTVAHKLLALVCFVLLLRSAGVLRSFQPPGLLAARVVFALAFLSSFATGIVQSIPASASSVWLNLHRVAATVAAIACAVAARLMATAAHS